jgi:hypothetical protein
MQIAGIRTVVPYTEPATGKLYAIVSGRALTSGGALNYFAWDVVAQKWVAKFQFGLGIYNDQRRWLPYQGKLYVPVGKSNKLGGALLQYTGNFANVPPPPVPGPSNNFNQIPVCGTNSSIIPPTGGTLCFAFQDVADFDGIAVESVLHTEVNPDTGLNDTRIVLGTWPPPGMGSIYLSPSIPAGGFGTPTQNPAQYVWTKLWDYNLNYDPDPVVASTVGVGAMSDYNGVVYWGTMVYGMAGTLKWMSVYGQPTTQQATEIAWVNTFRTGTIFNATNLLSHSGPTVNGLYALPAYYVWDPVNLKWMLTPTNAQSAPLYGGPGFGNPYNNYIWTMSQFNGKLYVGTMDWGYMAADGYAAIAQGQGQPIPDITKLIPPQTYGADLYYFKDTSSAAVQESIGGLGNFLNYGVRGMIPSGTSMFIGTANPMNLATTSPTAPHGGWELIEATSGSQTKGR